MFINVLYMFYIGARAKRGAKTAAYGGKKCCRRRRHNALHIDGGQAALFGVVVKGVGNAMKFIGG
jgi:hypothetical protein